MAKYTATSSVTVYNTVEEAVAGLEAKLETADVTRKNINFGVTGVEGNKHAGWLVYTDEA
jgi:hypothetical protein